MYVVPKFKAVSGTEDQAAGLVWRCSDPNNYCVVRANALEDNVVLYKVQDGKRTSLATKGTASNTYGVKVRVPKATWSALKVTFQGKLFTVFFDGKQIFNHNQDEAMELGTRRVSMPSGSVQD